MQRYNPKDIEPKWQQAWADSKIYEASDNNDKPKKYILEFFPYPSGAAMHVGHVRNYAIGDAIARFNRMRGYNVLHPMGWDGFGLPAENFAIKNGISPRVAIDQNTGRFKEQLTQMGFGYDWSREIDSTDPNYYKWTQWFFKLLFKKGLAYQQDSLQWWCPVDKTVLANEQVEAGRCWRCGSEVEKKALKQWFFKITDYADRLAKDLDDVDWTDSIKTMQRNWIGRSKGAEVEFAIDGHNDKLSIFTTRPDTLFGATFMVLAPEHPLVGKIAATEHKQQVENYQQKARNKSDIERQETNREKTGVFTGAYAVNPVNGEKVPIWIADYVLMGYGTGAIMAVPAHDERDFAFAKKFDLPIKSVIAPEYGEKLDNEQWVDGCTVLVYDETTDRYLGLDWKQGWTGLVAGGINEGESYEDCARRELAEEAGIRDIIELIPLGDPIFAHYQHKVKGINRIAKSQGYLAIAKDRQGQDTSREEHESFENGWYTSAELHNVIEGRLTSTDHWLELLRRARAYVDDRKDGRQYDFATLQTTEGIVINSGKYDGTSSAEMRDIIVADLEKSGAGHERINYKMRDWLISRQRYWGAPIPIVHCAEHGAVAVPDDQLPVVLPELDSFEPSGDGRSPLARVPEFVNTTCPECGGPATRETDTMDGFACSSWYFLRFADPRNTDTPFDADKAKYWLPVDDYIGGAEHAVMHLLYARMWTKVMQDEGLIDFGEPFKALRNQGMILAPDGQKMSKSKGNTIQPDDLIDQGYGADSIRIMELFIGPWNQSANWSVEGMGGSFRFLQRVWNLTQEFKESKTENQPTDHEKDLYKAAHAAIKKVSSDLENLGFNTAIAALMELVNELYKIKAVDNFANRDAWKFVIESFLQLLSPFAPHITEELWHQLGNKDSIHTSKWPIFDEAYLVADTITVVVQVNGKVRAQLEVAADATKEQVLEMAEKHERIVATVDGKPIKKSIYVPGKLVNFVV